MTKIKKLLYLICAVAVIITAFISWRYAPLTDGEYIVGNNIIEWRLVVSNAILKTAFVKNKSTGKILKINGDDFVLRIGHANSIGWSPENKKPEDRYPPYMVRDAVDVTPNYCRAKWLVRGFGRKTFVLVQPELNCEIRLAFFAKRNEPWIRRKISLKSLSDNQLAIDVCEQIHWKNCGLTELGGKGQPVFIDNSWFVGLEHPYSKSYQKSGEVILRQFPGNKFGKNLFNLQTLVLGAAPAGKAKMIMNDYVKSIRRPIKSVSLFNTWCHMREDELTEKNMIKTVEQLHKGLAPYDYMFDVFVIDDGWQEKKSVWGFRKDRLPRGLSALREKFVEQGSKLGLWVSLPGSNLDIKWGEKLGFKAAFTRFYCLSTKLYNDALRVRLKDLIKNDKVSYFKHDFNYFVCGRVGHGHFISDDQSSEANVNALLSVLKYEAKLNPDLFLAVTSGLWPSPWWLPYCDTTWMGGKDHDANKKIHALRGCEFEMNYRDGALYKMLVKEGKIFPLSALMTHGIVDARHNVYNMTAEDDIGWCNYLMNYLGRGTLMREFYLSPELITKKRWEMIARGLRWAKNLDAAMADSHFILGNPLKAELFGYQGDDAVTSYVSLRNPSFLSTNISLRTLGMTNGICEVVYPYHKIIPEERLDKFDVPANSVVQIMSYPESEIKTPVILGARAALIKSEKEETEYELSFSSGTKTFYVESPVKIKSISGEKIVAEKINDKKWKILIPDVALEAAKQAEILSAKITDAGVLICSAFIPRNINAEILFLADGAQKAAPLTTINGTGAKSSTLVGDGWRLVKLKLLAGTNDVRIGFQGIGKKIPDKKVAAYLKTDQPLRAAQIKIVHESLSAVSIYDKPYPVIQNIEQETFLAADKIVTLSPASSLLRGKRALNASQLSGITNAVLKLKRFDVNGGKYDDKKIYINGELIGKIPPNNPPLSQWEECEIIIPSNILNKIKLDNVISVQDKTGDAYKIRDLQIDIFLDKGKKISTSLNPLIYSTSLEWELGEGEILTRDGAQLTILSF